MGRVVGTPGGSLSPAASWGASARAVEAGASGERRTGRVLNALALSWPVAVLHDLSVPGGGDANIDHVVVSGSRVRIVESKCWRPGVYWTLRGRTFRGWRRFAVADKRSVPAQIDRLASYIGAAGTVEEQAVQVIWPSTAGASTRLGLLRLPSARPVRGDRFARDAAALLGDSLPADARLVDILGRLVRQPSPAGPPGGLGEHAAADGTAEAAQAAELAPGSRWGL